MIYGTLGFRASLEVTESMEPDGRAVLDKIRRKQFEELELNIPDRVMENASRFASESPDARGLYVVRAIASEWLLGSNE